MLVRVFDFYATTFLGHNMEKWTRQCQYVKYFYLVWSKKGISDSSYLFDQDAFETFIVCSFII